MREGDVILKVAGVAVKNIPQLQEQVIKYRPGNKVNVTVWRGGKLQEVQVTMKNRDGKAELEDFTAAAGISMNSLGAQFTLPSASEKDALKITGGAKVETITPGKLKSIGIQRGFIITKVDGQKIESPEQLESALQGKSGNVLIEGVYTNGTKAYYGFSLN
jgi:S1-C subfamily serine protease